MGCPEVRKGFGFNNPDLCANNGWGAIITPDELRYIYAWGNPLVAPNADTYTDEMLQWYIDNAVRFCERDLNVDIIKKRYRYRPILFDHQRDFDTDSFEESYAKKIGCVNLRNGANLTTAYKIKLSIDKTTFVEIDVAGGTPGIKTIDQIVNNINTGFGSTIAYKYNDDYLMIRSNTKLSNSFLEFIPPSSNDCLNLILGLSISTSYHYIFQGWVEDRDFFWEEPYDFSRQEFQNFIFLKLRQRPLLKLWKVDFRDVAGGKVADITNWVKPNYRKGSLQFFPNTGALANLPLYAGASFPIANAYQAIGNYPDSFFIDYDAGFESSLEFRAQWTELCGIIGMLAAINLLNDYGDGKAAAIASSSIGLSGVSESYSTTQSATNAMYGARIISYRNELKRFYKENRNKYAGLLIGAL